MDYKKLIVNIWRGDHDFRKTFWIYYVLIGTVLSIPTYLIDFYYESIGEILALFLLIYIVIFYVYIFFAMVGTWKAATKYNLLKKKKKDSAFWGYAAKTYLVLTALNVLREIISPFIS
jgi:hypothetical protein